MEAMILNYFLTGLNMKVSEDLAVDEKIGTFMVELARHGLLKFGKVSVPYIMRKLKVSESTAKIIVNSLKKATSDNDSSVAL